MRLARVRNPCPGDNIRQKKTLTGKPPPQCVWHVSATHMARLSRFTASRLHNAADVYAGWGYNGEEVDAISFTVDKDIFVHGPRLFGSIAPGVSYTARLELHEGTCAAPGTRPLESCVATYTAVGKEPVLVAFDTPARVRAGVTHTLAAKIKGPDGWAVSELKPYMSEVSAGGVKFVFTTVSAFGSARTNATDARIGQIPCIDFSVAGAASAVRRRNCLARVCGGVSCSSARIYL